MGEGGKGEKKVEEELSGVEYLVVDGSSSDIPQNLKAGKS